MGPWAGALCQPAPSRCPSPTRFVDGSPQTDRALAHAIEAFPAVTNTVHDVPTLLGGGHPGGCGRVSFSPTTGPKGIRTGSSDQYGRSTPGPPRRVGLSPCPCRGPTRRTRRNIHRRVACGPRGHRPARSSGPRPPPLGQHRRVRRPSVVPGRDWVSVAQSQIFTLGTGGHLLSRR